MSFLSVFSSKASQSLRQAAATSYISLHRAFESNTLWNAEIKAVASDALVRDLQRQRHELKNWDITWACTQDPDQLLGRHIWHNPNLKILGFRSGMAPTTDGFDQITQALVRFETTQVGAYIFEAASRRRLTKHVHLPRR